MYDFIDEKLNNVLPDVPNDLVKKLKDAYFCADEEISNVQFISENQVELIEENGLHDFYDLDYFLILPQNDIDYLKSFPQVLRSVVENCEGIDIEIIRLESFFINC